MALCSSEAANTGEATMATTEAEVTRAHREKMARIKVAKDRLYASKTLEKELLIVHTGTGKGKSTAGPSRRQEPPALPETTGPR
jgi:hypothetical protein